MVKSAFHFLLKALLLVMPLVYLGFGLTLLINPSYFENLKREFAILLGITLILYGGYRGYRTYHKLKSQDKLGHE